MNQASWSVWSNTHWMKVGDLKGNILMLTNKHSKREKCVLYRGKTNSKTVDLTNKNTKSRFVIELLLERWEGHMQLIYCLLEN